MLRQREQEEIANRQRLHMERESRVKHKQDLQTQMVERERLREEALKEYEREKQNVEAVISGMIQEDQEMEKLKVMKQEQARTDMLVSMQERLAQRRAEDEREAFENEQVRRYALEQ